MRPGCMNDGPGRSAVCMLGDPSRAAGFGRSADGVPTGLTDADRVAHGGPLERRARAAALPRSLRVVTRSNWRLRAPALGGASAMTWREAVAWSRTTAQAHRQTPGDMLIDGGNGNG